MVQKKSRTKRRKKRETQVLSFEPIELMVCEECGRELPSHKFPHYTRKDGTIIYRKRCYTCSNAEQYERRKELMKEVRERGKYAKLDTERMIDELKRRGYEVSKGE